MYAKIPITMEGTPFSRSVTKRITDAKTPPAYSARYTPAKNPIGTPTQLAINSTFALPSRAFAMPPPVSPTGVGSLVKKFQLSDEPPFTKRYPRMKNNRPTASTVHTPVRQSITAFTAFRRKESSSAAALVSGCQNQHPRQPVQNDCPAANKTSPNSIRALVYVAPGASRRIRWRLIAAIVYPGASSEVTILGLLPPTTMVTAMVSPKARARAGKIEPMIPRRA